MVIDMRMNVSLFPLGSEELNSVVYRLTALYGSVTVAAIGEEVYLNA
jgi:hypothetical protein